MSPDAFDTVRGNHPAFLRLPDGLLRQRTFKKLAPDHIGQVESAVERRVPHPASRGMVNDQCVWMIRQAPSIPRYTSVAFQRAKTVSSSLPEGLP